MPETEHELTAGDALARIKHLAVEAALHFNNAEIRNNHLAGANRNVRDVAFQRRDALIYRFDAIVYHLEHLRGIQLTAEKRLMDPLNMRNGRDILAATANKQRFVFDDIVFNGVSLFDYFGRFAATTLQADPHRKLRWDTLYKWSKHAGAGGSSNRIAGTKVAAVVVREDQLWIKHFVEYRSKVIHYESEKANGTVEFRFAQNASGTMDTDYSLRPFVPVSFLSALKIKTTTDRVAVLDAASLLVRKLFDTTEALLIALVDDLESRVPTIPAGTVLPSPTFIRTQANAFD
jgi:hypothetical protein